jgi:hypothetical protein
MSVTSFLIFISENPNLNLTIDNRTVTASWRHHFSTQQPIYYEVSAGTTLGGADIIQWQETQNSFLEFVLPPKIKSIITVHRITNHSYIFTAAFRKTAIPLAEIPRTEI